MRPVSFATSSSGWRNTLLLLTLSAGLAACADAPVTTPAIQPAGTTLRGSLATVQSSGAATNIALVSSPTTCIALRSGFVDDSYVNTATCNTSSATQRFTLRTTGEIRSASDPRWCIDIGGQRGNDGDPLALGYCASVTSQKWTVTANGELRSRLATARCITATTAIGGNLRVRNCGTLPAQQRWTDVGSGGGTTTPPATVARVDVTPASSSLQVGQSSALTATPRDANGTAISGRTVTWSSSAPSVATVSASGLVSAIAAGSASIGAVVDGVTGTASVTVTSTPPAPVATVSVTLASASRTVGQTTQATATLRDANGTVLTGRAVTWTSSNPSVATVSGSGLVTAVGAGSANITASSEGRSGSAPLTVTAPPTGGAGPDTIFVDRFESGTLSLWQDGVDPARHRVVTTQPHGGTRALEITTANGDGGWLTRFFMPGYDSVYVSFWVRYGSDWTAGSKLLSLRGSRIDNQWSGFGNAGRCPTGTDFFSGNVVTDGAGAPPAPGPLRLYTYYPGMPSSGGSCGGDLGLGRGASYADVAGGPVALAPATQWHRVEYFFRLNTPGQTNSEQYVWVDGRRVATWTGISIRTTTDLRLNSVQFNISGATGTQHVYFDDIVVLRGRPSGLP